MPPADEITYTSTVGSTRRSTGICRLSAAVAAVLAVALLTQRASVLAASPVRIPLGFEPALSAENTPASFVARGRGHEVVIAAGGAVFFRSGATRAPGTLELQMRLVGARASARAEGFDPLPGRSNYYAGNDPSAWRTDVPRFPAVRVSGVYPGIDLV